MRRYEEDVDRDVKERALNFQQISKLSESAGPVFVFLGKALQNLEPIVDNIYHTVQQVWTALEPYNPEDLAFAFYGLALVFFGGVYMTLVASLEAAHLFGWAKIKAATRALYVEFTRAKIAFDKDNKVRILHIAV